MTQQQISANQTISDKLMPVAPVALSHRATLRKTLLQQRRSIDPETRNVWNQAIVRHLLEWCQSHQPASLGVYWPIQGEVDLRDCYHQLTDMGIQLALPLVTAKAQPLKFLEWQTGDAMSEDEYGIPVPAQRQREIRPAALLIPCVGYNQEHFRLGYGGGFYDRTLAILPRLVSIGIAYSQALAEFPSEQHDIAMDLMITEKMYQPAHQTNHTVCQTGLCRV